MSRDWKIKFDYLWLLWAVIGLHLVMNLIWLAWDQSPPAWDQAAHLRITVLFNKWLTGEGDWNFIRVIREGYGYPPLIHLAGAVWSLALGVGIKALTYLNSLFLAAAIAGVYFLGREILGNKKRAVMAAILFAFLPVVYELSRNFLLDMALITWVVWGFYFYLKSDYLHHLKEGIVFSLFVVLASLTKLNGFIYFSPLLALAIFRAVRGKRLVVIENLAILFLVFMVAAGWWWLVNWQNIVMYLTGLAGQGEELTDPMNFLSLWTWVHYFRLFFWHMATPLAAIVFVFSLFYWSKSGVGTKKRWLLLFFVLVNYAVFTVIRNKDYRFVMPLLPMAAVMMVGGLAEMLATDARRQLRLSSQSDGQGDEAIPWGKLTVGILVSYLGWFYVNNSFNWPIKKEFKLSTKTFVMGEVDWINVSDYPVRSPKPAAAGWPQAELVKELILMSRETGKLKVLMLVNIEELNDNNLKLYREMLLPDGEKFFEIHSTGSVVEFKNEAEIKTFIDGFDLVIAGNRELEPAPFYSVQLVALKQARDYIWSHPSSFEEIKVFRLPNKRKAVLLRRR